jgi:hypothetical protein
LALNPRTLETIIAIVVLASTWIGPEMGAVSGAGCEGTILDGAGRVVVVAVETGAAENPEEHRQDPTAGFMTGTLILEGTHRTVGRLSFRLRAAACATRLTRLGKKVISTEVET